MRTGTIGSPPRAMLVVSVNRLFLSLQRVLDIGT